MEIERLQGETSARPFPIYEDVVQHLATAHIRGEAGRDPTVAHTLAVCAGYAYADIQTVSTMMARVGLEGHSCVRIAQTVDAMFIFSTAYLLQSRCGRVVVLCYRGTEPANLGAWLADADVDVESVAFDGGVLGVHSGFYRNVRATRYAVIEELKLALEGRSLLDHRQTVKHPLEALYVSGHSLGGAMALLLSLSLAGTSEHRDIVDRLRAVYTFGQPIALAQPFPPFTSDIGRRLFRHVTSRDPVPALPAASWGEFTHIGHEYHHSEDEWRLQETPTRQLANMREIPRSLLSSFVALEGRRPPRFRMAAHVPHHYIAALRPKGRITEFGDRG